ncbi:MAG TPA: nuclear transport factor 2 family protein [Longimicrobium sp.]|nr:nuclear transport factor 2 family protein [Longimicrobium sp.]
MSTVLEPPAAAAPAEANRATVARLMTILGGQTPIEAGAEFIHPDVVANFDGWRFQGIDLWANWIRYLRTRPGIADLRLVMERIEANPNGTVTACGRWHALRHGRPVVSNLGVATYRFEAGRIVEIWTTRRNYLLLFGPYLKYRWGLVWTLYRMSVWKRRTPQLALRAAAEAAAAARPPF